MYATAAETAQRWGVDPSFVLRLAREGRIEGACHLGKSWMIPANAQKPADGRSKEIRAKAAADKHPFRFPLFLNDSEDSYIPPLNEEEKQLHKAMKALHAMRMDEAREGLIPLSENAQSIYIRAASWLCRWQLAAHYNDDEDLKRCQDEIKSIFSSDFPYKKEMELLRYRVELSYGFYRNALENFRVDPSYTYHPSACNYALVLSLFCLQEDDFSLASKLNYSGYELLCDKMEQEGDFAQAQALHYALILRYQMKSELNMMVQHMRSAMRIAYEHELYYLVAGDLYYYQEAADKAFAAFPADFVDTIKAAADEIRVAYLRFASKGNGCSYWNSLTDDDFAYIALALQGFSNRETAGKLGLSEKTVSNRYVAIYGKLGVGGKRELLEKVRSMHMDGKLEIR